VQHALRTFTPEDADALRKTVRTFPASPDYELGELLTALGTGEAALGQHGDRGLPGAEGGVVGAVLGSSAFRAFARSAASALGREISRGVFGTRRRR